jgi:hypothetical protein
MKTCIATINHVTDMTRWDTRVNMAESLKEFHIPIPENITKDQLREVCARYEMLYNISLKTEAEIKQKMLAKVDKAIATISLADIEKNCERIDSQARADQNKKIGEYIEHWYDEWDDISSWNVMRRFVSQLELGKFSPEEAVK